VEILLELHGDRGFKDDKAMIGGLGNWSVFMILVNKKGYNTKTRQYRNLGWQTRRISKALRLMKMAEKFGIPVLTLIDTRAYPKRKNAEMEAIARNIFEMVRLKVPIITIIVGEGASVVH
jgi:acetyl-CoA carboxylase carboxyl transferase subunit alpha